MARRFGLALPAAGLATGGLALALWVSPLSLRWLDLAVLLLFVVGLALSIAGYVRGDGERVRQLGVIAIGWNAFGLTALLLVYWSLLGPAG